MGAVCIPMDDYLCCTCLCRSWPFRKFHEFLLRISPGLPQCPRGVSPIRAGSFLPCQWGGGRQDGQSPPSAHHMSADEGFVPRRSAHARWIFLCTGGWFWHLSKRFSCRCEADTAVRPLEERGTDAFSREFICFITAGAVRESFSAALLKLPFLVTEMNVCSVSLIILHILQVKTMH